MFDGHDDEVTGLCINDKNQLQVKNVLCTDLTLLWSGVLACLSLELYRSETYRILLFHGYSSKTNDMYTKEYTTVRLTTIRYTRSRKRPLNCTFKPQFAELSIFNISNIGQTKCILALLIRIFVQSFFF